ncbi:MAG TPA: hypothetical protein VGP57_22105 [Actinoplanes sp.]|nr:hypothetical protein [Actinoplanes sp.]
MPLPSHDRTTRVEVLIVETALQNLWMSVPQAAVIWIAMLLVAAVTAAALTLPGRLSVVGQAARRPAPEPEPDDGRRYCDEVAAAAERAAGTAERRRAEWEQAQVDVDAAWAAYDQADAAARRAAAASAFPVLRRRRAPGENADRERHLHRTATAACRRKEISIAQLNDALAHRGWDARKHPVAQEAALRNAVRAHRFDCYRAATAREREAWQTAEQAAAALRSLRAEALDAKVRASQMVRSAGAQWWAEQWATTQPLPVVAA